jgi:predicted secreted protein
MARCLKTPLGIVLLAAAFQVAAARAADTASPATDQDPSLAQEGVSLQAVCGKCHSLQIVMDTPMSYDEWHDTVQKMIDRGAAGTDDQLEDIMDYLHRTMTSINVNAADVDELAIVLDVSDSVARTIAARRSKRKFTDLADLKSVQGIDASAVDARARLIYFK